MFACMQNLRYNFENISTALNLKDGMECVDVLLLSELFENTNYVLAMHWSAMYQ